MRKRSFLLLSCAPLLLTGCGMLRNIEQWKCDNWGMCHFGTSPSQSYVPAWESSDLPPVYAPAPVYGESDATMLLPDPLPEPMSTQPGGYEDGNPDCVNCAR